MVKELKQTKQKKVFIYSYIIIHGFMASNILWNTWITFNVTLCRIFKFLCWGTSPAAVGFSRDCHGPPRSSISLLSKTLRLHTFFISYFWGKEILPEHFKQYHITQEKKKWKKRRNGGRKNQHDVGEAECAGVILQVGNWTWWGMWIVKQVLGSSYYIYCKHSAVGWVKHEKWFYNET